MDWQAAATQLLNLVLVDRTYPADFDFEAEWPNLLAAFREAIRTDARLAQVDAALKQRIIDREAALAKLTPEERELVENQ